MSDTNYSSANLRFQQSAYVDEAWLMDSLSDDDIDIPKDLNPYDDGNVDGEDDEEDDDDEGLPSGVGQETWGDLGLDRFLADLQQQPLTLNSLNLGAMDAIAASTIEEGEGDNGSVGNNNNGEGNVN